MNKRCLWLRRSSSSSDFLRSSFIFFLLAALFLIAGCETGPGDNGDSHIPFIKTIGGGDSDVGRSVTTDKNGNIYVTGFFCSTVDFDPGSGVDSHASNGSGDIFLTRINSDGTYGWTKTIGGSWVDGGNSVTTDDNGAIYVAGSFEDTVDFDPGSGVDSHTSNGNSDIFLTRINSDGTYAWTKTMGGTSTERGESVTTDDSGNIYVTGYFVDTVDFDPGSGTHSHTSNGGNDIFLTRINSNGTYGWTITMGGATTDQGKSVTTDDSGNIYVTGFFEDTVDFDPGSGVDSHTSNGSGDIFLTRINSNGTYGWTKIIGGASGDGGNSVTTDDNGAIYVAGSFEDTVDFDPGSGTDEYLSQGATDIFLTRINSDGSYGWTVTAEGANYDGGESVAAGNNGAIYVAGHFEDTVDFDPGVGVDSHTSNGSGDIFLTRINSDGTYGWTKSMGGAGNDSAIFVTVDRSGTIYLTGCFSLSVDFDLGTETVQKTSNGGNDIFLLALLPQ